MLKWSSTLIILIATAAMLVPSAWAGRGKKKTIKGYLVDVACVTERSNELGTLGIVSFTIGMFGLTYLGIYWIVDNLIADQGTDLHNRPILLYALATMLLGAQFISMGFLAELLTSYLGRDVKTYSVKSRVGEASAEKDVS